MSGRSVTPIVVEGGAADAGERLAGRPVIVPEAVLDRVREGGGSVELGTAERAEAGRDWWPIALAWASRGQVPARPAAVVRPVSVEQVAQLLAACSDDLVPVTPIAGRSGVCGGSVALYGGVALDCTGLVGDVVVDETSLVAEVPAGIFGDDLERSLRSVGPGYTLGHWPQSMELSTVGGWIACRGAGQYSTRYGKIEDMVVGLEVVLADGRVVRTGGNAPRSATGPSLTQLFTGSEGVLGVITRAWLRVHPVAPAESRRAFGFGDFADGLDACRRILRRGATPAVLRLYDRTESERTFGTGDRCVLVLLDEADPPLLAATMAVVDDECATAEPLDETLVDHWLATRNDVSALAPLWAGGVAVDTAEVAGRWTVLPALANDVVRALAHIEGTLVSSVHQSHAYPDGACLYFTFAGQRPDSGNGIGRSSPPRTGAATTPAGESGPGRRPDDPELAWLEAYYRRAWDALTAATIDHGAAISHHHGIGLNRARFAASALGEGFGVLASIKRALDPNGILNPGKLGLGSPFGEVPWP